MTGQPTKRLASQPKAPVESDGSAQHPRWRHAMAGPFIGTTIPSTMIPVDSEREVLPPLIPGPHPGPAVDDPPRTTGRPSGRTAGAGPVRGSPSATPPALARHRADTWWSWPQQCWAWPTPQGLAGRVPHRSGHRLRPRLPSPPPAPGTATAPAASGTRSAGHGAERRGADRRRHRTRSSSGSRAARSGSSPVTGMPASPATVVRPPRPSSTCPVAVAVGSTAPSTWPTGQQPYPVVRHDGRITTVARVSAADGAGRRSDRDALRRRRRGHPDGGVDGATATLMAPSVSSARGAAGGITVGGYSFDFDPDAIAVSTSGDVYVANSSPKAIIRFSPTVDHRPSSEGRTLATGQTYVTRAGLAAAPDGTVVVADYGRFAVDRASGSRPHVPSRRSPWARYRASVECSGRQAWPWLPTVRSMPTPTARTAGPAGPALLAIDPDGVMHVLATGPPTRYPGHRGLPALHCPAHVSPIRMSARDVRSPNTSSRATRAPSQR